MTHSPRLYTVDALRGLGMLWMAAFHFCFDLTHFNYLQANFYEDPFWTLQRSGIVSLFLFCAGMGQALARGSALPWAAFWKRWTQIAGGALLVTASSYLMFPNSFIYFGVLHGMAVMLIVARLCAHRGRVWGLLLGGTVLMCLPWAAQQAHGQWPLALDGLNAPLWNWLGLISRKPITEDHVPLAPWLGVMLWGVACGRLWLKRHPARVPTPAPPPAVLAPLARLGRHSLPFYLLHQPVLIGALLLVKGF